MGDICLQDTAAHRWASGFDILERRCLSLGLHVKVWSPSFSVLDERRLQGAECKGERMGFAGYAAYTPNKIFILPGRETSAAPLD